MNSVIGIDFTWFISVLLKKADNKEITQTKNILQI